MRSCHGRRVQGYKSDVFGQLISREENEMSKTYIANIVSVLLQFCQLFRTDDWHFESL